MSTPQEVAKMLTERSMERAGQAAEPAVEASPNEGTTVGKPRNPPTQRTNRNSGNNRVLNDLMDTMSDQTTNSEPDEGEEEDLDATPTEIDEDVAQEGDDADLEAGDEDNGGEEDAGTEDDDEGESHLELDEDYTVSVKVDGETKEVTLRELLDNYSHSGAADKRLKEATETLKEAKTSREKAVSDAEQVQTSIYNVIRHIDDALHRPNVTPPDESLKQTNPSKYLRHMEAYQQDQMRIQQSRETLKAAFAQQGDAINKAREANKAEQFRLLQEHLPALRDPKQQQGAMNDIVLAAKHFGFSDDEISDGLDHRYYLVAHAAAQYLKSTKGKLRMSKTVEDNRSPNKVMRSGRTKAKSRASAQQKKVVALKKRAQTTGKPEDVAAYMTARRKGAN